MYNIEFTVSSHFHTFAIYWNCKLCWTWQSFVGHYIAAWVPQQCWKMFSSRSISVCGLQLTRQLKCSCVLQVWDHKTKSANSIHERGRHAGVGFILNRFLLHLFGSVNVCWLKTLKYMSQTEDLFNICICTWFKHGASWQTLL